jgi:hypothetical protein
MLCLLQLAIVTRRWHPQSPTSDPWPPDLFRWPSHRQASPKASTEQATLGDKGVVCSRPEQPVIQLRSPRKLDDISEIF